MLSKSLIINGLFSAFQRSGAKIQELFKIVKQKLEFQRIQRRVQFTGFLGNKLVRLCPEMLPAICRVIVTSKREKFVLWLLTEVILLKYSRSAATPDSFRNRLKPDFGL